MKIKAYCFLILILSVSPYAKAQVFDDSISSGPNFNTAAFRLWCPESKNPLRGILVLVPGSNTDGRNECMDTAWQKFASKQNFALLGCYFLDIESPTPAAELYANAANGSGQALLNALERISVQSNHPEIDKLPLLLWGFSAGGQFNYEFACWKPARVLAFVVNKGGIYYTAFASEETRSVPGIFFVGTDDLIFRNKIIEGVFAVNRRFGAIWTFAEEHGAKHEIGMSRILAESYFNKIIPLRLPASVNADTKNAVRLNLLTNESGNLGDPLLIKIEDGANWKNKTYPTSWLPDNEFAERWINFIKDRSK